QPQMLEKVESNGERDLFGDGSSDTCRDCWINENFEPINQHMTEGDSGLICCSRIPVLVQ
ncbi:MAG: hypothetical protein ACRD8Z_15685, partial [Nitrososphaeraceae archaeon]